MDLNDQKVLYGNLKDINNEKSKMNKLGLLLLFFIFCFIFIMNVATPLIVDDYFVVNIHSYSDIFNKLERYYFLWGGRIPGSYPVHFFLWKGKEYFNLANAFIFVLLVAEIYWISNKGKASLSFNPHYIIGIFFSLWAFNASFIDTCLWLSGASNYLWMMVVVLAFLLPWVRFIYDGDRLRSNSTMMAVGMFILGTFAGWTHESTICWLILSLAFFIFWCKKKNDIQNWQIFGFAGLCLGYFLLIFAPGNFVRFAEQAGTESVAVNSQSTGYFFLSGHVLHFKLIEIAIILYFHIFLWYIILSFLLKYKNENGCVELKTSRYIVAVCSLIAAGSAFIMFLMPTVGLRPSFIGLVFLTIAVTTIFRVQDYLPAPLIGEATKMVFKRAGYAYLIITMCLSVYCNCINAKQWNEILHQIKMEQEFPTDNVLEVNPYFTDKKSDFWLVGTGFHLIEMPVTSDLLHQNNRLVAKYYGIKGIRKRVKKQD